MHSELNELPLPSYLLLLLSELLVQFAQFIPEEQRQNGVRTKPEIRGSQSFVKSRQALLPQCLRKAVDKSFIKLSLNDEKMKFSLDLISHPMYCMMIV